MEDAVTAKSPATVPLPVRKITAEDLRASLADGYTDFKAARGDLLIVGMLYPLIGFVAAFLFSGNNLFLLFPVFAGLSLLGPFVATGFYELARRREAGMQSSWTHFFDVLNSPSITGIVTLGIGLVTIFGGWIVAAWGVYAIFFGPAPPASLAGFFTELFTTGHGWAMIVVGNLVGFCFALIVLAVSVVSLPLLVDRKISPERAVATSLAAFRRNSGTLLRWGATVAVILALGAVPLLIGLAVALPVLGYATWHLYTRLVDRSAITDWPQS